MILFLVLDVGSIITLQLHVRLLRSGWLSVSMTQRQLIISVPTQRMYVRIDITECFLLSSSNQCAIVSILLWLWICTHKTRWLVYQILFSYYNCAAAITYSSALPYKLKTCSYRNKFKKLELLTLWTLASSWNNSKY